jgi:ABC-type multidrug transport system ATPase subunit
MTVRECLIFSARLKLNIPEKEQMERVEGIIDDLRL